MNKERCLLVISGPSGAGKDTVVKKMLEKHPEIEMSVSATTRAPREKEVNGVDYYFLPKEEFERRLAQGDVLEYVQYCDNYYGTLKSEIEQRMEKGVTTVLIIEVYGAANIKKIYPESTLIFVMPPNEEELARRLRSRGTESEEVIQQRLHRAKEELGRVGDYDFAVTNVDADVCAQEVYEILCSRQGR